MVENGIDTFIKSEEYIQTGSEPNAEPHNILGGQNVSNTYNKKFAKKENRIF